MKQTIESFKNYKNTANQVLDVLCENEKSSLHDISIIYNMIMGFPYCINEQGQYIYHGELYENMESLPIEALQQIIKEN